MHGVWKKVGGRNGPLSNVILGHARARLIMMRLSVALPMDANVSLAAKMFAKPFTSKATIVG